MTVFSGESKRFFFLIKPMVYFLKIIGLAPFAMGSETAIHSQTSSKILVFKYSKIGLAYNVLFLIPMLVIIVITFYEPDNLFSVNRWNQSVPFDAAAFIRIVENVLFVPAASVAIIFWGWKQRDAVSVMNRLLEVDFELSIFEHKPFDKRSLTFLAMHTIINVSLWITIWVRRIVYSNLDELPSTFFTRIPNFVIYWSIIEYFIVVSLLAQYLRTVNKCLLNFNELATHSSLKILHGIRTKLSELCGDVSTLFSFPILFSIVCCFVPLVYEFYALSVFRSNNENASVVRTTSYTFVVIFLYVYPVLLLSLNVTRVGKESKLTGSIIHKLLASPIGRNIKAELAEFSLQLLHEDATFTACGFFSLDSTLLVSMLGGAAAYFVVLMQFKSSACTCENSNTYRVTPSY